MGLISRVSSRTYRYVLTLPCLSSAFLICPSVAKPPVESCSTCTMTPYQKPLRTSELSAPEKKVWATKAVHSTESFQVSCAKVATLPESTLDQVSCQWPTADQTPTVASFF